MQKQVPDDPLWTAKQDSHHVAEARRAAGPPPLDRARAVVAPRRRRALARERARLLRPAVRDRRVAPPRPDELAGVPRRRLGPAPVPVAELAGRQRLGRVQRPADHRLLHHGLRRGTARAHHRARHVARAVDAVSRHQQAAQHPDRALAALPRAVLVSLLHRRPRHAGVHDRPAAEPEPHLRGDRHRRLGRVRHVRGSMVVVAVAWVAATPVTLRHPRWVQRDRVRADRPGAAAVRARRRDSPGVHREGHLAVLLAQRQVSRDARVPRAVRQRVRDYRLASTASSRIPSS